jgi:hypothetical protein
MSQQTKTALLPNPALYVTADHNLKQEAAPVLHPAKGEVLLHIKATGVCGYKICSVPQYKYQNSCSPRSDIHFWKSGRIGSLVVEGDCILGHEAAGIVLECGEDVTTLQPGTLKSLLHLPTSSTTDPYSRRPRRSRTRRPLRHVFSLRLRTLQSLRSRTLRRRVPLPRHDSALQNPPGEVVPQAPV